MKGSVPVNKAWVYGRSYTHGGPATGAFQSGTTYTTERFGELVGANGEYPRVVPPTYKEFDLSQFVNVKNVAELPVKGDGRTDE